MYVNKCIKCGREFETKNPKRVICPDCLYPDKKMMVSSDNTSTPEAPAPADEPLKGYSAGGNDEQPRYYSAGGSSDQPRYNRPQQQRSYNSQGNYNRNYNNQNNYNNNRSGYNRPQNNYNRDNRGYNQGGYNNNRSQGGYSNNRAQGGYNRPQRPYNNNNQGNFRRPNNNFNRNNNFQNRRPMRKGLKQLLVSREQLEQIEKLYKAMLPLPNPDCHEVIAQQIGLEPRKVFFGINLIRQKMMLPKLPFPKRKLAISPDQLFAIKNLYEPLLPLPPIGCHKIIAAQLKMDEWRVHVGIGLIRSQMGLGRWNENRTDLPEETNLKKQEEAKVRAAARKEMLEKEKEEAAAKAADAPKEEAQPEVKPVEEFKEEPKAETSADVVEEKDAEAPAEEAPAKPKRGRKPKKVEEQPEA